MQSVPHSILLRAQVTLVMFIRRYLNGHILGNLKAVGLKARAQVRV